MSVQALHWPSIIHFGPDFFSHHLYLPVECLKYAWRPVPHPFPLPLSRHVGTPPPHWVVILCCNQPGHTGMHFSTHPTRHVQRSFSRLLSLISLLFISLFSSSPYSLPSLFALLYGELYDIYVLPYFSRFYTFLCALSLICALCKQCMLHVQHSIFYCFKSHDTRFFGVPPFYTYLHTLVSSSWHEGGFFCYTSNLIFFHSLLFFYLIVTNFLFHWRPGHNSPPPFLLVFYPFFVTHFTPTDCTGSDGCSPSSTTLRSFCYPKLAQCLSVGILALHHFQCFPTSGLSNFVNYSHLLVVLIY